jgi:hypothetical protein
LQGTPFSSFFIPGLILFFLPGALPAFIFIGPTTLKNWSLPQYLNIYKNRHWIWTFSLCLSVMLILWVDFQVMLIGLWSIYSDDLCTGWCTHPDCDATALQHGILWKIGMEGTEIFPWKRCNLHNHSN